MSSPSQQQDKLLRLARTRARTTLSEVKRSRGTWEQAVKDGRRHLEEACNAITRLWMWPRLCSDSLARCHVLLPVGMKALRRRYVTEMEALRECQKRLEQQAKLMHSAMEALKEAIAPVENRALFTCFAARDFYTVLNDVVGPYAAQLEVCSTLVKALPPAAELFDKDEPRGIEALFTDPQPSFLSTWEQQQANAMVVTWMLQTKLDRKAMDSKLQLLNEDVRTV